MFLRRVLPIDLWEYFRAVPQAGPEYFEVLRAGLARLWPEDGLVPWQRTAIPLRHRISGWLVLRGMRAELEDFLGWLQDQPAPLPTREVDGVRVVDHPFADHPDLPPELRTP